MWRVSAEARGLTKYVLGVPLIAIAIKFANVKIQQVDGIPAQFDDAGNLLSLLCILCFGLTAYFIVCVTMELLPYFAEDHGAAAAVQSTSAVARPPTGAPPNDQALIRNYDAQALLGVVLFAFEGIAPVLVGLAVGITLLPDLKVALHPVPRSAEKQLASQPTPQYVVIVNQK